MHDAVIIGGGPAGSVAAIALRRRGWRVMLADRGGRGRSKCCGHCLHPRAIELLNEIDCGERVRGACRATTMRGEAWRVDDRGAWRIAEQSFAEPGLVIAREVLDAMLLDEATRCGVDVRLGVAARLESPGAATLVIGADGLGSVVARRAGLASSNVGRKFGFALDIAMPTFVPHMNDAVTMFVAPFGYLGVVVDGDVLHCAACVRGARPPLEVFDWFVERASMLRDAFGDDWRSRAGRVSAIGPMPWRTSARTVPGVALVGDAAGYAEPFTGEGMTWAIESALALADSAEAPGRFDDAARRRYETRWDDLFARAHRRSNFVASIVARPTLLATLSRVGAALPSIKRRAVRALVRR